MGEDCGECAANRFYIRVVTGTVLIKNADELLKFSNEEEGRLEEVCCCC